MHIQASVICRLLRLGPVLACWVLALSGMLASGALAEGRVYAAAEQVQPLSPGDPVPSVTVETVRGEAVDLAERVREQGALLVFYRGGW